ncbi:Uncharacterized protein OS=Rhodopirellula europaea 6C GN=RE6C_03025 PE=4 SV=1 [Gemmata massiliana]|uniref:Uncharacterized protein n=1 Tax=Gemmata massiliana TaxID=1210884 RepID=A0A6P2CTI9_9BACT|nr:hypothetical protein [Gemmata massiliana]VTR91877.1 Uncharacterized protein OS=Rhodopirellula europaea 6C GN=RE6C_03025 PE=4 SV=1 [Gemmata massiliana]
MTFTTEDLGDVPNVTPAGMDEILATDAFGAFAILSASDEAFIQAGNDWQPDEDCRAFLDAHDSDPWLLEHREYGRQFRVARHVTLEQVRQAFHSYLTDGSEWRTGFAWSELQL